MDVVWIALIALVVGIGIGAVGFAAKEERVAEDWGKHLKDWDGTDYDVVFTADPHFYDQDHERRVDRDVIVKYAGRRVPWKP